MRASLRWLTIAAAASPAAHAAASSRTSSTASIPPSGVRSCRQAIVEGTVHRGQGFRAAFTPGLDLLLEPLPSGWIVRVIPAAGPGPAHDAAELATPPYRSVTPLLVSTDWAFRAQDALGWNPRRFRYAATPDSLKALSSLYERMLHGEGAAAGELATLTTRQPEAKLEILDATLVPGAADQTPQAAAVATHFETTPHRVQQAPATPLGSIQELHFRVRLDLPQGRAVAPGVHSGVISCAAQPTRAVPVASQ